MTEEKKSFLKSALDKLKLSSEDQPKSTKTEISETKERTKSTGSLLKSAFDDLDKELNRLRRKKENYEVALKNLSKSSKDTFEEEEILRGKLHALRSKEVEINNIKQNVIEHLEKVKEKLEKVKQAKDELESI